VFTDYYGFRIYIMIVPIALAYFAMRHFTKRDQWSIDNFLDHIMQKDILLP